jgi:hypothetical protein
MKSGWLCVVAVLMMAAQGCIVIESKDKHRSECPEKYGADPQDTTVMEIDAISKLSFANDQQAGYKRIAQREDLSEGAQVYLVAVVFKHLSFENAQMDVLMTLVNNPSFSEAAKRAILERMDRLAFENNKAALLEALSKH